MFFKQLALIYLFFFFHWILSRKILYIVKFAIYKMILYFLKTSAKYNGDYFFINILLENCVFQSLNLCWWGREFGSKVIIYFCQLLTDTAINSWLRSVLCEDAMLQLIKFKMDFNIIIFSYLFVLCCTYFTLYVTSKPYQFSTRLYSYLLIFAAELCLFSQWATYGDRNHLIL